MSNFSATRKGKCLTDFKDNAGHTWNVELDGLLLGELREKAKIDIVQDGLYAIEEREDVLTKALLILCREQRESLKLSEKDFSRLIVGEVQTLAIDAVRGAAGLFFRPNKWSEIQLRSQARREADEQYRAIQPMLAQLNRPDMPESMREAVMSVIGNQIEAVISSQQSEKNPSVHGQDANQQNTAGALQGSSESTQKE